LETIERKEGEEEEDTKKVNFILLLPLSHSHSEVALY
jgi:hypothetical protein